MGEEAKRDRKYLGRMFAIGAIASACGIALGLLIDWFPTAAAEEAGPIDTLWDVLLIVSVPIFVLVVTIVLYSVARFRMPPGEVLADIEGAKADSMDVRVVGEQFTWTFHYRDADGKPVSSNQLYVPVGRQ